MSGIENQQATRRDYAGKPLRRHQLPDNPVEMFGDWLETATKEALVDATAMTLATVDANQQPNARTVLMKSFDEQGLVWYTDYTSQKGAELATQSKAALLFYWRELERQVRVLGTVSKVAVTESDSYFQSRPLGSQISAAASQQSQVIANREDLERAASAVDATASKSGHVERPPRWGGYRLEPSEYEFWQGRVGRLHDRFVYRRTNGVWGIDRLQP